MLNSISDQNHKLLMVCHLISYTSNFTISKSIKISDLYTLRFIKVCPYFKFTITEF